MSLPLISIAFNSTLKLLPEETEVHCITNCLFVHVQEQENNCRLEQEQFLFPFHIDINVSD